MPSHYGFVTSAEVVELQSQETEQQEERKRKEVARLHPLIASVLNDFITVIAIPNMYLERRGSEWCIIYSSQIVYCIAIVQEGKKLWLEYKDEAIRQTGSEIHQQCTQVNIEKIPAILKILLEVDVQRQKNQLAE